MGWEVTGFIGQLTQITPGDNSGTSNNWVSATVAVGDDQWVVTTLSGPFIAELGSASAAGLIGRTVRVFMVNGQPEIAYTTTTT